MAGWNWNPFNRGGGGMEDDFSSDDYPNYGHLSGGGVSTWDSDSDKTTTYDNWAKYDAGQPSGSWFGDSGYQGGMSGSWAQAFNNAQKWNRNRGVDRPGYLSPSVSIPGAMGQKLSPGKTIIQPYGPASEWGKYQMYNHAQKSGGGIGGMVGSIVGTVAGSTLGPLGAKIGGTVGGSIGSSFG